jgi:hypothetical protein
MNVLFAFIIFSLNNIMSTAFYPLGMKTMPSSGYNHNSTIYNKQYIPWKGTGRNQFPVGSASGHIRPLTNNDSGNVFPTGFGLARPIKHYRKGRQVSASTTTNNISNEEDSLIDYNMHRYVKSSKGTSLGGGFGGSGLLNDMQDKPGAFVVFQNPERNVEEDVKCQSVKIVASYKPNTTNLLENPEPNSTNPIWCCNQEKFAKQRVIYASTNLKKNYYTTTKQYLQNRCKTYDQKAFNFLSYQTNTNGQFDNNNPYYANKQSPYKPGSPNALTNTYLANCQLNTQLYEGSELAFNNKVLGIMLNEHVITQDEYTAFENTHINSIPGLFDWIQTLPESQRGPAVAIFEVVLNNPYWGLPPTGPTNPSGCQLTVYKPNNYQYAKQGAVDSSTRLLKLNVSTISTNVASLQNYNNTGPLLVTANQLYAGDLNTTSNLLKNKAPSSYGNLPLNFSQSGRHQNKKICHYSRQMPQYQIPKSQPSAYRYYPGTVFSSNHYSQSPNTYTTTHS